MLKTSSETKISRMLSRVSSILKSAYFCAEIGKNVKYVTMVTKILTCYFSIVSLSRQVQK